jgi:hypothetical protein
MANNNEGVAPVCRLTSLRGFKGVIIGRDLGGIFEEGHVYAAVRIMGEIIIKDLGEHAVEDRLQTADGILIGTIEQYAVSGVTMLTREEYEREKV